MESFRSRLGSSAVSILLARHSYVSSNFDCWTHSCGVSTGLLNCHSLNCISDGQLEDTLRSKRIPLFQKNLCTVEGPSTLLTILFASSDSKNSLLLSGAAFAALVSSTSLSLSLSLRLSLSSHLSPPGPKLDHHPPPVER
jgi:hypothetical protein